MTKDYLTTENFSGTYFRILIYNKLLTEVDLLFEICSVDWSFGSVDTWSLFVALKGLIENWLTIRPVARKGYGTIAHEAKLNGLLTRDPWGQRVYYCFSITQLVG